MLSHDVAAALPEMRRQAESLMGLTLTAYSPNGTTTDADDYQVPAYAAEGTTRGKVQAGSQASGDAPTRYVNVGGVERPVIAGGLHIPLSAPVPVASEQRGQGWEYVVTGLGPVDDPALLGRRYLVVGVAAKSYATARRLDVVEVS
jgi:hypothetical protein